MCNISKIANRWTFSALWIEGDDSSDDATTDPFSGEGNESTEGAYIAIQQADNGSVWQQVETGKTYTYYLEPAEGWTVNSVTFNGTELTVDGNYVTTPAVSAQHNKLIVTFERMIDTQVSAAAKASNTKVLGNANGLHITNATAGDQLSVYTADGRLVATQTLRASQADVALQSGQLYIVHVGQKVVKVRL